MNWNGLELPDNPYYQDGAVVIYHADCREILPLIPDKSIDLVLTDPPYGMTQNSWDIPVALNKLWALLTPPSKETTPFVMTANQPFASKLVVSNIHNFKYDWVWDKRRTSGFLNSKKQPLRQHEHILVFYRKQCVYNPIKHTNKLRRDFRGVLKGKDTTPNYGKQREYVSRVSPDISLPRSIITQTTVIGNSSEKVEHPTQKPIALFNYLIETYTNTGNLILDPFLGSGTTAYCAKKLNRKCIGIEISEKYCEIATKRCSQQVFNLGV